MQNDTKISERRACQLVGLSRTVLHYESKAQPANTIESGGSSKVEVQRPSDDLWLGMERRRRGHREIIFYHLLLDMGSH